MEFSQYERNGSKRFTGLIIVVLLHVFVIYALVTGLARQMVDRIQHPLETKLIEEVKPPPPPDEPPPPPPKLLLPPPPFIPPPEVQVQQPPQVAVIANVTTVKPEAPQPFTRSDSHTSSPAVVVAAIVDANACKPSYPPKAQINEETGVTTVAFLIGLDGRVVESKIEKSSGFRDLDNATRSALSLCRFKPGTIDGKPQQSWTKLQYVWKLEN